MNQWVERGLSPELDLRFADTQVGATRRAVAQYTQLVAQDVNALNLLAGGPVPAELLPSGLDDVAAPLEVAAGLSSDVLLLRPDVLGAEHQLRSADANIEGARAAFFPRISLTAALGLASRELRSLFESDSTTWGYASAISIRSSPPASAPRTR